MINSMDNGIEGPRPGRLKIKNVMGFTDTGNIRANNEDSYGIAADQGILVLADGMGGHNAGEIASRIAVESVQEFFSQRNWAELAHRQGSAEHLMAEALVNAHLRILQKSDEDPACFGMGTTAVLAWLRDNALHLAHVGDSRAYLIDGAGINQLTADHSLTGEMVQMGYITAEQARVHPLRSQLTRALGVHSDLQPDYSSRMLKSGDIVVICSDGLWDMLEDSEIQQTVLESAGLEAAGRNLIDRANEAGGEDNITVILLEIE